MKTSLFSVGLTAVGMALLAPSAIAYPISKTTASMTELALPTLTAPVNAGLEMAAPQQAQVLPAGDFVDVAPTHWAYNAVNNLAESYGCLAGYPDGTFRGDDLVTRYEFAAAMDACMGTLLQLVESVPSVSSEQILDELDELNAELGTLSDEIEDSESEILVD